MPFPLPSNRYGLAFHHLGLAVASPETAVHFLQGLGYRTGPPVFDPLQNVHLLMGEHSAMPAVEVIYPAEGKSPLDRLLREHKEGLVYHMCYTTPNLDASLDAMEGEAEMRLFCVSPPKPAILFGGKQVSFYMVSNVGLIEIINESSS